MFLMTLISSSLFDLVIPQLKPGKDGFISLLFFSFYVLLSLSFNVTKSGWAEQEESCVRSEQACS